MKTVAPKRSLTNDALKEIYQAGRGRPDLTRLERRPRRTKRMILLIILGALLCAAVLAAGGFFLFTREKKFANSSVRVTIDTSDQLISGDEVVWTVHVRNGSTVAMTKTEINVTYPDGFTFVSSQPVASNEFHNSWSVGNIAGNSEERIAIVGMVLGDLGSTKTISVSVHYQPANFSSDFEAEASTTTTIAASVLDVTMTAPNSATNGQTITTTIAVKNTSKAAIKRIRLSLDIPDSFSGVKTEPAPTTGSTEWDKDSLNAGESFSIKLTGVMRGTAGQWNELKARAGILDADSAFRVQRERSSLILILEPTLNVAVLVDGSAKRKSINPTDVPKATLTYSNDSDTVFTDVTLTLTPSGKDSDGGSVDIIDSTGIIANTPANRSSAGGKLVWSKAEIADLARLVPKASGSIDVSLPLKKKLRSIGSGKNFTLTLTGTVSAASVADTNAPYEKTSDPIVCTVNTELRLAVEGRYYSDEGVTLGSGPIPPQVGTTTTYQIFWYLTNTLNGVKDALVKAALPEGATFVQATQTDGNAITYDSTTREVRWQVAKIDAGVGQTLPTLSGSFTVSITPTPNDLGTTLTLLNSSTLTATDAFTGAGLTVTGSLVTTDLTYDPQATGKGTVVAAASGNANTNQ